MKRISTLAFFVLITVFALAQNGVYMEYSRYTENGGDLGITKLYSSEGNTLSVDSTKDGSVTRNLRLKRKPTINYFIMENGEHIDIPVQQSQKYKITILGNETLNGYACIKLAVDVYNNGQTKTLWITDQLPDYERYLEITIGEINVTKLNEALKAFHISGIPIRIGEPNGIDLVYNFIKMEARQFRKSMFELGNKAIGRTLEQLRTEGIITEEEYKEQKAEEEKYFKAKGEKKEQ